MPKLPDRWIAARAADDTEFSAKCACSVDSDGLFSIVVDERILESAYALAKQFLEWPGITVGIARTNTLASSKNLAQLVKFLNAAALDSISGKETRERIIAYDVETDVSFWINDSDGSIHPNGGSPEADEGRWWKAKVSESRLDARSESPFYSIGIGAAVFDKITTTRSTGSTVRYDFVRPEHHNEEEESTPWGRLNSFSGQSIDPDIHSVKQMPYSDAAARFFYDTMLTLCKIARNMDDFFGDKDRLHHAIETRTSFLLPSPK